MERNRDPADIRYSRIAEIYDAVDYIGETSYFSKSRKQILVKVEGKILEVGIGTGQSFKDYPHGQEIAGIDISEKMLGNASEKAKNHVGKVELHHADLQDLPFKDNTFDTIFTSFVFCSVTDPARANWRRAIIEGHCTKFPSIDQDINKRNLWRGNYRRSA